jgi:hypothetical protein
MLGWFLINLSVAAKQFQNQGSLSLSMALYQAFSAVSPIPLGIAGPTFVRSQLKIWDLDLVDLNLDLVDLNQVGCLADICAGLLLA